MSAKAEDPPENEPSTEEGEGAPAEGDAGGGSKKKLILIIAGAVLLLGGAGAGLYFTGMLDSVLGKSAEAGEEHAEGEAAGGKHDDAAKDDHGKDAAADKGGHGEAAGGHGDGHGGGNGLFLAIPTMIVNLNTEDDTPRYLRLTVQLEMKTPEDVPAVEAVIPRVIDQFQTYLRELRVRDLRGSAGIYRLQMELLWRVNQAAAPVEVKDVLFQEILIQ